MFCLLSSFGFGRLHMCFLTLRYMQLKMSREFNTNSLYTLININIFIKKLAVCLFVQFYFVCKLIALMFAL